MNPQHRDVQIYINGPGGFLTALTAIFQHHEAHRPEHPEPSLPQQATSAAGVSLATVHGPTTSPCRTSPRSWRPTASPRAPVARSASDPGRPSPFQSQAPQGGWRTRFASRKPVSRDIRRDKTWPAAAQQWGTQARRRGPLKARNGSRPHSRDDPRRVCPEARAQAEVAPSVVYDEEPEVPSEGARPSSRGHHRHQAGRTGG